jgi:hypothetical protein
MSGTGKQKRQCLDCPKTIPGGRRCTPCGIKFRTHSLRTTVKFVNQRCPLVHAEPARKPVQLRDDFRLHFQEMRAELARMFGPMSAPKPANLRRRGA